MHPQYKIDQFSDYNQDEVKTDLRYLLDKQKNSEIKKELNATKKVVELHHKDILSKMTPYKLSQFIKTEFMLPDGKTMKNTAKIINNPSHDLMTQICLDRFGYHQSQIDSDDEGKTKEGVRQFLSDQKLSKGNDTIAGKDFFERMYLMFTDPNNPIIEKLPTIQTKSSDTILLDPSKSESSKSKKPQENLSQYTLDLITNHTEELVNKHYHILGPAYSLIKGDFVAAMSQVATKFPELITDRNIYRTFWLIHKENPSLVHNTRTSVGQVGRPAYDDAMTHLRGFNNKLPFKAWKGVKNVSYIDQIKSTMGYAKLCGLYDATNNKELGIAFTKYNLGPYHHQNDRSSWVSALTNQAKDIKNKAKKGSRYDYALLTDAEREFYLPEGDFSA